MEQTDLYLDTVLRRVEKPGRYTGGEYGQVIKDKNAVKARFAFAFPDTYEIGMSNLGMRILYGVLNSREDIWCERVFAPWVDMEAEMRRYHIPLFAHESRDPLTVFDIVGFTLQYELCYTNVLNMLSLSGIPLLSSERDESYPIIIGGGPCAYNPEPVADFFDVFSIGEGEEALLEFTDLYIRMKESGGYSKAAFLHAVAKIPGFYVPSLYTPEYHADGTVKEYRKKYDDIPSKIRKRIIKNMDESYFPASFVMPYIECVHDRIVPEVYRGCIRGCRFCQAGMTCRPVREKSPETVNEQAKTLFENTGYEEISLCSLSISDYSRVSELTDMLLSWTDGEMINLSLPSLRVDSFTKELMNKVSGVRMSGLTFAPEAGTQRLRDAINKNVSETDLLRACRTAFSAGKTQVKLYFMMGLPTEKDEDLDGIGVLCKHVVDEYYANPDRPKGKSPSVTASVACFIPKPFTPFQWDAQNTPEELAEKQKKLIGAVRDRKVKLHYHGAEMSRLEAVFARGDRKLSRALSLAAERGVRFDSWDEFFSYDGWMAIFSDAGIDPAFYANRTFAEDEVLPWDIIDCGVSKEFLLRERHKAYAGIPTENCREKCHGCGADKLGGDARWCPRQQNG